MKNFPGPEIIQYIITYGVAITLCVYIVYYLYKEYDIIVLKFHSSVRNLALVTASGFITLYLIPYFLTSSLHTSKLLFTIPFSILAFIFLILFYKRISNPTNPNQFIIRRNRLSIISVSAIALLPVCTAIGDYQWITFTIMNCAFFSITSIEIDRHLYFLENKNKMFEVISFYRENREKPLEPKLIYQSLTRREIEIAISILNRNTYKEIGQSFFIAERTVSKHASNIFKKTGVKNRVEFLQRFGKKSKG
ncbi:helix-turn-helix transcriptional regulator [Aquimarina sp. U1-2]|uniref:helix-turn-helix domain-containing protein n=1 Tax=Aquimarina sp. U1-2 TaxID=2823141 RepID=UPI001FED73D8|nr:helix-turn-helix transcriptional regulator [Aquimarina sp. U1-2]